MRSRQESEQAVHTGVGVVVGGQSPGEWGSRPWAQQSVLLEVDGTVDRLASLQLRQHRLLLLRSQTEVSQTSWLAKLGFGVRRPQSVVDALDERIELAEGLESVFQSTAGRNGTDETRTKSHLTAVLEAEKDAV